MSGMLDRLNAKLNAALCERGKHDRRRVSWLDIGVVHTPAGPQEYSKRMRGYLCRRCEPIPCAKAVGIEVEGKPDTWPVVTVR